MVHQRLRQLPCIAPTYVASPPLYCPSTMDSKGTHESKRGLKDKMINKDEYLIDEDFEDDMEEEEGVGSGGAGGYADDEKKKGVAYGKRGTGGCGGGVSPPSCQVDMCGSDLSEAKKYHRKHKVCELHAKAPAVLVAGLKQRFCQQCSRFHELSEFDEAKRSCRRRLAGHNERRRKTSAEPCGECSNRKGIGALMKESQCRPADERSRLQTDIPGNPNYKRSQIR